MKKLHLPHHKIPTIVWNHWNRKGSKAKQLTYDEVITSHASCGQVQAMPQPLSDKQQRKHLSCQPSTRTKKTKR